MDGEAIALSSNYSDVEWNVGLRLAGFGGIRCRDPIYSCFHRDQPCQRPKRGESHSRLPSDSCYNHNDDENEEDGISNNARGEMPSASIMVCASTKLRHSMFVVGYALTAKKSRSFIQPSLVSHVRKRGIIFVMIDCNRPLDEQGPFDVILHKMVGESWHRQLNDYKKIYTEALILDPPKAIAKVFNRETMLQEVAALNFCHPQGNVMVPKQLVVDGDPAYISLEVANSGLKFPLVIKAKWMDGTPKSHALLLAFNDTRLAELTPPLVLQEFVNHGGVLFKVYVIGHVIKVVRRFSLPDNFGDVLGKNDIISCPRVSCAAASADGFSFDSDVGDLPPKEMLESLSKELRARLGLTLFNLDIIRERGTKNHYYVVDINYFPGYGKVPQYEEAFTEFLSTLAGKKCK